MDKATLSFPTTVLKKNETYTRYLVPVMASVFQLKIVSFLIIQYNYMCDLVFYWLTICYLCWYSGSRLWFLLWGFFLYFHMVLLNNNQKVNDPYGKNSNSWKMATMYIYYNAIIYILQWKCYNIHDDTRNNSIQNRSYVIYIQCKSSMYIYV